MSEQVAGVEKTIFSNGTLMNIHIGRWTAVKKMKSSDLLLDAANVDEKDALYLGHKKLLPKVATENLQRIESEARAFLYNRSVEFPITGARFVSYAALPEVIAKLRELRTKFQESLDALVQEYPTFKAQQLVRLEEEADKFVTEELKKVQNLEDARLKRFNELQDWKKVQRQLNETFYPSAGELRSRFYFDWRTFEISPQSGGIGQVDAETAMEMRTQMQADLRSWVKEAAAEMHKTLGQAAANAQAMLVKHGKLDPRNLRPLLSAFEAFKAMDFTGKSEFRETIDQVKRTFLQGDLSEASLAISSSDGSKEAFSALLGEIGKLAVDDVAEQAGLNAIAKVGDFARALEL